jgi:hypothetical protein
MNAIGLGGLNILFEAIVLKSGRFPSVKSVANTKKDLEKTLYCFNGDELTPEQHTRYLRDCLREAV